MLYYLLKHNNIIVIDILAFTFLHFHLHLHFIFILHLHLNSESGIKTEISKLIESDELWHMF